MKRLPPAVARLVLLTAALAGLAGCAPERPAPQAAEAPTAPAITPTAPPTPEPASPTPEPSPTPIANTWTYDFASARNPEWTVSPSQGDVTMTTIEDGQYVLRITPANYYIFEYYVRWRYDHDVQMEIDVEPVAAGSSLAYGFLCHGQSRDDAYGLLLTSTGNAIIVKFRPRSKALFTTLAQSAVQSPGATRQRLGASCRGSRLALSIDGKEVVEAQDAAFTEGWTGFLFYNMGEGPAELRLDNAAMTMFYPPK